MLFCLLIKISDLGCLYIWREQGRLELKQIPRAKLEGQEVISGRSHLSVPPSSQERHFGASHPDPTTRRKEVSPVGTLFSVLPSRPQSLHLTSEGRTERIWVDDISKFEFLCLLWGPTFSTGKWEGWTQTKRHHPVQKIECKVIHQSGIVLCFFLKWQFRVALQIHCPIK